MVDGKGCQGQTHTRLPGVSDHITFLLDMDIKITIAAAETPQLMLPRARFFDVCSRGNWYFF